MIKQIKKISGILILAVLILPQFALAASLNFDLGKSEIRQGDVVVAELKLSTPDQPINVMDGVLYFDTNIFQVEGLSTGNSIFQFWPSGPAFSNDSGKIFFTGGTTGQFQAQNGLVLKVILLAKKTGTAKLTVSEDTKIYLADGKGTKISASATAANLTVQKLPEGQTVKDAWAPQLTSDLTPPENLTIELGKDSSVFDGQYFISFSATDSGSGIYYYQVKEGNGEFITTQSPYLIKDQSLNLPITVKVFDKSGNTTQTIWTAPKTTNRRLLNLSLLIVAIILIVLAIIVYKKWQKTKTQN